MSRLSDDDDKIKKSKGNSLWENLKYIFVKDGHKFGGRAELHECGATRSIADPQIWTHFLFLIGGYLCFQNGLYDMLILINIVIPLSTCYHYTYEQSGFIAHVEAFSAKVLFVYGFAQLFHANIPPMVLAGEVVLLLITVFVFVYTNIHHHHYDPWHSVLHVVSGLWSILVASFHGPLIVL